MSEHEPQELAEPLAELRDLELEPGPDFLDRVRASVDRRRLAAETADLGWVGVQVFVLEVLDMIFGAFRRNRPDKGDAE